MKLSPSDLAAIEAEVRAAEARTIGEIYCVVAEECSDYGETPLAWAAGVALLVPLLLLLAGRHLALPDFSPGWSAAQAARPALFASLLLQAVLFAVTLLAVSLRPVRRRLTPPGLKRERVRRRAREQFLARNLHLTRERTGVLIFVSFAERMAELIADQGIAEHVGPHVWDKAMAVMTAELRRGDPAAGFAAAIRLCGEVLAERFPADPEDNPDELPNGVVILPRG